MLGPGTQKLVATALALFNDVIMREAAAARVPVLDLRVICAQQADYSHLSAIEPSAGGGEKIARAIAHAVTQHDFRRRETVLFGPADPPTPPRWSRW
jgi:hypothetical protein